MILAWPRAWPIENSMIIHTSQNWEVGSTVRVGFLMLTVVDCKAVKDYLPDVYLLARGMVFYRFIPHHGLVRLNTLENWEIV